MKKLQEIIKNKNKISFGLFVLSFVLLFSVFSFVLIVSKADAATGVNRQINFQGKLVDNNGLNVADSTYTVVFSLYSVSSGGTNVWTETDSVTTKAGIFQVALGATTPLPDNVYFNQDNLYLGIKVGSDAEMTPRIRFTAVPYALNAASLNGVTATQSATGFNLQGGTSSSSTVSFTTSAGALSLQPGVAEGLTIDTNGASALSLGNSANSITFGGTNNPTYLFSGSGGLTVNGTSVTLGNSSSATIQTTAGSNAGLTLLSQGSGNITLGQNAGNGDVVIAPNAGGQAALLVKDFGSGDLFTASAGATTKFVVNNNGNLQFSGNSGFLNTISTTGTFASAQNYNLPNAGGTFCLSTNNCGFASGTNYWQLLTNTLSPGNSTYDFLVGGNSTTSAKFAFINNSGLTTPTASISANSGNNATFLTGTGTLGTTNGQSLTLGTSGNVNFFNANNTINSSGTLSLTGAGINLSGAGADINFTGTANNPDTIATANNNNLALMPGGSGEVGINVASNLLATLDVRGNSGTTPVASVAGATTNAAEIVDQSGSGDIFTASKSGATKFVISNDGTIGLDTVNYNACSALATDANGNIYCSTAGAKETIASVYTITAPSGSNLHITFTGAADSAVSSASGTIVFPANTTKIAVQLKAAGGGGGGVGSGNGIKAGGGGGEGGYSQKIITSLVSDYYVKVGGGGNAGSTTPTAGGQGTATCIGTNSSDACTNPLANATGGSGGTVAAPGVDEPGGAGGVGVNGDVNITGQSGAISVAITGGYGGGGGGIGGATGLGVSGGTGNNGVNGGGGSGGFSTANATTSTGGNGGNGYISFTIYTNAAGVSTGDGWLQYASGVLAPISSTTDVLIGSNATSSADFGFLNVNTGTPTASISAGAATTGATYITGAGVIQTTNNQTLTLGGGTTGNIILNPLANNSVGIGTQNPLAALDVRANGYKSPVASLSGQTGLVTLLVDNSGIGDLFTASKSGATKFIILNNGNIAFAGTNNVLSTLASVATSAQTWTLPNASGTVCLSINNCGFAAGTNYWQLLTNALVPGNTTYDFLLGGNSTASARFAFINNTGATTPVASISANSGNNATFLTGTGTLGTTNGQSLTMGTSGNVNFFNANNTINGSGNLTLAGTIALPNNTLTGASGLLQLSNGIAFGGTTTNQISNAGVANLASETLTGTGSVLSLSGAGATFAFSGNGLAQITTVQNNNLALMPNGSGDVGINASSGLLAALDVRGNTATTPAGSFSATSTYAGLDLNNNGSGDLFTASKSGATKFTILNNGNIAFAGTNTVLSTLASSATSVQTWTLPNATGTICVSTNNCGFAVGTNEWQQTSGGALIPTSITNDILAGGLATASARFAVINMVGTGTPTASISANSGNNATFLNGTGTLGTTNGQSLTLGTSGNVNFFNANNVLTSTGNFTLAGSTGINLAGSGADLNFTGTGAPDTITTASNDDFAIMPNGSGHVGINASSGLLAAFDVRGNAATNAVASVSGATNFAAMVVNNSGAGDIFTASKSGSTKFAIMSNGNIAFAGTNNVLSTLASVATSAQTWTLPNATGTLCLSSNNCAASQIWNTNLGSVVEGNTTQDLLLGGTATTSAKFAVINVNTGTPVASLSAGIAGGAYLTAAGVIQTTANQTLTLGGTTTGNIILNPASGNYVGIDTQTPLATLDVRGALGLNGGTVAVASISGKTSFASLVVNNTGAGDLFTASSSGQTRFTILQNGNVNIGTASAALAKYKLTVSDYQVATAAAYIANTAKDGQAFNACSGSNQSGCHTGLIISLGQPNDSTVTNSGDVFEDFVNGQGRRMGAIRGNNAAGISYDTIGADYAEYFVVDPSVLPSHYTASDVAAIFPTGTLVCQSSNGVIPCSTANDSHILGIISEHPGFIGGEDGDNKVLVGLLGQLPLRVSNQNGPIKNGDSLAASGVSGVAVKATQAGAIVGRALEDFTSPDASGEGQISVFVNQGWYDPMVPTDGNYDLLQNSDLSVFNQPTTTASDSGALGAAYTIKDGAGIAVTSTTALAKATIANIQAGAVVAKEISTDSLNITTGNIMIGGQTIHDYITAIVKQVLSEKGQNISTTVSVSGLETATQSATLVQNIISAQDLSATVSGMTVSGVLGATTITTKHIAGLIDLSATTVTAASVSAQTITADTITAKHIAGLDIITTGLQKDDARITALESLVATQSATPTTMEQLTISQAEGITLLPDTTALASTSADLHVKGNGLIEGILHVVDTLFANNFIANGVSDFFGSVVFHSGVTFEKTPTFTSDTAGGAVIKKGTDHIDVTFAKDYDQLPVVNASITLNPLTPTPSETPDAMKQRQNDLEKALLAENVRFVITNRTVHGFTILLEKPADEDIAFSWLALAVQNPVIFQSASSVSPTPPDALSPSPIESIMPSVIPLSPTTQPTGGETH